MLNQCNFIGNLGGDPEVKYTPGGDAVCNFTVACGEKYKDKSGEMKEVTEWVRVVAWRRLADICGEYLQKGSKVFVSGKMTTRKWTDKDGQDRYTTEIVAREMKLLSPKGSSDAPVGDAPPADDIPF